MCKGFRYLSLDRQAWHDVRRGLSLAAKGLFDDLVDVLFKNGELPDDEAKLAKAADCHLKTFRCLWRREVRECFEIVDGMVRSPLADQARSFAEAKVRAKYEPKIPPRCNEINGLRARKSLYLRYRRNRAPASAPLASARGSPSPSCERSSPPAPNRTKPPDSRPAARTRLTTGWRPDDPDLEQGNPRVQAIFDGFTAYVRNNGLTSADWQADWAFWKRFKRQSAA
jgi:hypothetical protein